MDIAKIIKQKRGDRSQEQFAKDIGCSRQTVVWWETGRFVPSKEMLAKMDLEMVYRAVPQ